MMQAKRSVILFENAEHFRISENLGFSNTNYAESGVRK